MVRFDRLPNDGAADSPGANNIRRPPNYFSRAVQYRMLTLVFTLLAVLYMAGQAAKPSTWSWMFPNLAVEDQAESGLEDPNVDTRIRDSSAEAAGSGSLPPGVVRIESSSLPNVDDSSSGLFLDMPSERYGVVRDNTVFRSSELALWYELLGGLRDTSDEDLRSADALSAGFTQLYKQPNSYRGRLVIVRGTVRRAHRIVAAKNDFGIESYIKCWLFPDGSRNPVVVYATKMPDKFPEGMELNEAAGFRGVFFKRWAYKAKGDLMTAPMVLAKTADWEPSPVELAKTAPPDPVKNSRSIRIMMSLAAVVAALIAWTVYRQSVQSENLTMAPVEDTATLAESFDRLGKMELESPAEAMERNS